MRALAHKQTTAFPPPPPPPPTRSVRDGGCTPIMLALVLTAISPLVWRLI